MLKGGKKRTLGDDQRYIMRQPGCKCWKVYMSPSATKDSKPHQKYFSDSSYGGSDESMRAAQSYVKSMLAKSRMKPANASLTTAASAAKGLPAGVVLVYDTRGNRNSLMWRVTYMEGEGEARRQIKRSFGVKKYGYLEAFSMAMKLRSTVSGFDFNLKKPPSLNRLLPSLTYSQIEFLKRDFHIDY